MLDPRAIAHLGIGRRPIVVAMLGIWDELMAVLAESVIKKRGGAGGGKVPSHEARNKRNKYLRQQAVEEGEIMLILNVLVSQGLIQ